MKISVKGINMLLRHLFADARQKRSRSERIGFFFAVTHTKITFPIDFSSLLCYNINVNADLAHLVERNLAKVEVAGSIPVIRSKKHGYVITYPLLLGAMAKR